MRHEVSYSQNDAQCIRNFLLPLSHATRTVTSRTAADAVTYDDVYIHFTQEEWALLNPSQKCLYTDVMLDTYRNLTTTGYIWNDHNMEDHWQNSRRHRRENMCSLKYRYGSYFLPKSCASVKGNSSVFTRHSCKREGNNSLTDITLEL
ncbi:9030624G23Rik [Phodopus roborovskii]|uniref:9030624G23Rik protein n=1 Tax=Phodopus roborovskii TaxID=109678 RepID=A0AAU9Z113_PHORO|nr:9030624G23Rik [Phodopus roborovskii]